MSKKTLVVLSFIVASTTAACSSYPTSQVEGTIVRSGNFLAGSGIVVGVGVLPRANKGNSDDPNLYRISLQMDIGGFQQVDTDNNTFADGQAVELTNDGRIVHVSGTSLRSRGWLAAG